MNLNNKQRKVLAVIRRHPEAANNDAILCAKYWTEEDGWDDDKGLEFNLIHATRPETLSRRRRELHNLGLINYTETKDKERAEAFVNERNRASDHEAVRWLDD